MYVIYKLLLKYSLNSLYPCNRKTDRELSGVSTLRYIQPKGFKEGINQKETGKDAVFFYVMMNKRFSTRLVLSESTNQSLVIWKLWDGISSSHQLETKLLVLENAEKTLPC